MSIQNAVSHCLQYSLRSTGEEESTLTLLHQSPEMETSEEQTLRHNATAGATREERLVVVELEMFNRDYIEKCSDESTIRAIYEHLLRNEHGNFPDIEISVKEKLFALHRQKEQVKQMLAAVTKDFNALAVEDLQTVLQKVVTEVGFDQNRQKWVADLFNPNTPYDLENESFKIEREKWELNVRLYLLMQSKEWGTIGEAAQEEAIWRMREEMQVLRQKRDEHDRNLSDGNIGIEKEDGTSLSSWIPNQGEIMNPAESNAVLVAHYATENEKYFVEKAVFIGDRLVQDRYHRMDKRGNISLNTIVFTSVRHSLYYTLEEEGSPLPWNDIDVDPYCKRIAIMDKDAIILNKPIKGLTDNGGNKVSDERQLREQRIRYAVASKFYGAGTLNKKDLSEFHSLANLAFNVLAIVATTGQPAVVAAVGAQSKKIFRKSGGDAFMTSQINYVGWVYHPESMNRVCVTNLAYLRRSDAVMAQFLSSGVILRSVVYHYAENRCNDKYTDEEREAINARIGKVGTDYKVIAEAIEKYRESDSDNELMTNLEIFVEIASSLKGKVEAGAITGYKKLLELSEQADLIDEMVNEYHMREGSLTKRECFNAIKDTLLSSFTEKAKNVYQARLEFEKQREDVKTISEELARAKKEAKEAGGEVDFDTFSAQMEHKYRGISKGAIASVAAREKHNNDVKTISEELARAKKEAKEAGGEVDFDTFSAQMEHKYRGNSKGATAFVVGREKHNNDVKTISEELARAKKEAKEAGGEVDIDTFSAQMKHKNGGNSKGAIEFVRVGEKHRTDVKTISEELARAKKEAKEAGGEVDIDTFSAQMKHKNGGNSKGAIEFVRVGEKHRTDVKTISEELARAKKEAKEAGGEVDIDTFSAQMKHKNGGNSKGAIALVVGREKQINDLKTVTAKVDQFRRNNPNATRKDISALINSLDASEEAKQLALSYLSVLQGKKKSFTAVINSVEKAAKVLKVSVTDVKISQFECVECAKNRSAEYNDFFHVVAVDADGNKQLQCFLCSRQESVRSGHFTRVGPMSFADVIAERKSLDELSKQQRQKKKHQEQKKRKATKTMKLADHVNGSPLKKRKSNEASNRKNASPPPEAVESTKSSLDSSSAVVTPSAAFEKISDGRQLYVPALLQISVPPIPEYVPPLPLCVGSQATVDRNDVVPLPQPGHRVSIKRSWYTPYLGWLDEHGGTIKSTSEGEDGGMILHIACDLLQMGELEVPYPHDQVTVNFNQPKFSTEHYWDDSRLLSSYSNEDESLSDQIP